MKKSEKSEKNEKSEKERNFEYILHYKEYLEKETKIWHT